jgi:hypothetical protein
MPTANTSPPSQWPSLRRRARVLVTEMYAEAVSDVVAFAMRKLPPAELVGVPTVKVQAAQLLPCTWL